jgi:penicillin amidase
MDKVRLNNTSVWFDNVNTLDTLETASDLAIKALNKAVDKLTERLGRDMEEWQWGEVHTLTLKHPLGSVSVLNKAFGLNKGPFAVGGSYHTVSAYSYPLEDPFHVNHGSSHRHIYVCGDWDKSLTILPTGISGIPASPYYCSMTESFVNNIYKQDFFRREGIQNNALYRIEIKK